jgi:uncharacterized protein YbjT (DUF2867 family)
VRIAVVGGTGVAGRHVVAAVRERGHEPIVIARSTGVDLVSGTGLGEALAGAEVVVDAGNTNALSRRGSIAFFEAAARNLAAAAANAGVRQIVGLSILGSDRVPFGYYSGKQRQEQVLRQGSVPVSVLRATQFHEFAEQFASRLPGPVLIMPKWRIQPVAVAEVAAVLAELAEGQPVPMTELAGPQEETLAGICRRYLKARGTRKKLFEARLPGSTGEAMAGGESLPGPQTRLGTQSFDAWLELVSNTSLR